MEFKRKTEYSIADLLAIMRLLRSPAGCPWDRQQTHDSIRKNLIEETYEVCEAIDLQDTGLLREELGDVLLQVVFHTEMERERGMFDFDDVCDGICKKLIARHPHLFADAVADTPEEVLHNWETIKQQEKGHKTQTQVLRSVPRTLPSLMRCEKTQKRAAKAGFDYADASSALADLRSEVDELSAAMTAADRENLAEELGDVLFSVVNVARLHGLDAEQVLGQSCDKFVGRFEIVEHLAEEQGLEIKQADPEKLQSFWNHAKKLNK